MPPVSVVRTQVRAGSLVGRVVLAAGFVLVIAMPAILPSYLLLTVTISLTLALSAVGLSLLVGSTNQPGSTEKVG